MSTIFVSADFATATNIRRLLMDWTLSLNFKLESYFTITMIDVTDHISLWTLLAFKLNWTLGDMRFSGFRFSI